MIGGSMIGSVLELSEMRQNGQVKSDARTEQTEHARSRWIVEDRGDSPGLGDVIVNVKRFTPFDSISDNAYLRSRPLRISITAPSLLLYMILCCSSVYTLSS